MKKLIGLLAILSINAFGQINLKDDSMTFKNERPAHGVLSAEQFTQLNGFSKYSGTIQGFSGYCKFPVDSQKLFYNNFTNRVSSLNLTKEENEVIDNSFKQTAFEVKKNGIIGLSCEKFQPDFEKIIKEIKPQ